MIAAGPFAANIVANVTRGLAVVGGESCGMVDGVAAADCPTGLVRPPPWRFPPHKRSGSRRWGELWCGRRCRCR